MVDISDAKFKSMVGKSWSVWNLPSCSTELDSTKLRQTHKPKEPDKPRDQCNLLPHSLLHLYGTKPEIEYFAVTKCPACRSVMKSQWMSKHFKRDFNNSLVCRRTEIVVNGNKSMGKATPPLYDIRESLKDPMLECIANSIRDAEKMQTSPALDKVAHLSPRQKHVASHKTESSSSSSATVSATNNSSSGGGSSSKSKSNNSSSHSKKHSSSSSSSSSLSKHKTSSSKSSSPSNSWAAPPSSKKESSKSHKSHSTASYVLSIPSDESSHHESVESILLSNSSKQTMHIITGKSKSSEPEYEQLKFYADSSEKRSKALADDSKSHKLHFSPQLENFKIPLKNKPSSSSHTANSSASNSDKKSKSISHSSSSSSSHSSKSGSDSIKFSFRHSSSSSSSTITKPVPSLTIISEAPKMNTPMITAHTVTVAEGKEKSSSHSKKKKKKKSRDEPRKIIPLKERAFNPDQHCGVVVSEDTQPCTRSLTCKTHSIALRRAVPGRSHPFDSLLAAHKKARDEEKAKSKEVVEDPKSKGKKTNHSSTPLPADSDSSSSSLPQPLSVGKGQSSSSNGTSNSAGKSSTITFNASSLSESSSSSNGKHSVHSTSHAVSSKTASSHSQPLRQQTSKLTQSTTKVTNRPVIIVDEKKETQGLSLFDLKREPENNFVYITCVEAPKIFNNMKELEGKNSRSNALSEWNPLDRFSRKGMGSVKRKGFKDPLVALLPFKMGSTTSTLDTQMEIYAQRKDLLASSVAGNDIVEVTDGRTSSSTLSASTMGRSNDSLKRQLDSGTVGPCVKKSRLLTGPHQFYEPLLFKTLQKSEFTTKLKRSEVSSTPGILRLSSEDGCEGGAHDDFKTQVIIDEYSTQESDDDLSSTPKTVYDSLSIEAREFLQNYIKAHSDSKESLDKVTLSEEEMCQHAFELINKCFLS